MRAESGGRDGQITRRSDPSYLRLWKERRKANQSCTERSFYDSYTAAFMGVSRTTLAGALFFCGLLASEAQIDSAKRELIQLGYNQPIEGHGPLAVYGFYYLNAPNYLQHTNLTLRLAVAPVYLDSELGISRALGANTDLGVGLAGGGFADSYSEVRQGKYLQGESFTGHGGEVSSSVYHLFQSSQTNSAQRSFAGSRALFSLRRRQRDGRRFHVTGRPNYFPRARRPAMGRTRTGDASRSGHGMSLLGTRASSAPIQMNMAFNATGRLRIIHIGSGLGALLTYTLPELKHNFGVNLTAAAGAGFGPVQRLSSRGEPAIVFRISAVAARLLLSGIKCSIVRSARRQLQYPSRYETALADEHYGDNGLRRLSGRPGLNPDTGIPVSAAASFTVRPPIPGNWPWPMATDSTPFAATVEAPKASVSCSNSIWIAPDDAFSTRART